MRIYDKKQEMLEAHRFCDDAASAIDMFADCEIYGVETLYDKSHVYGWETCEGFLRATRVHPPSTSDYHYGCTDDCGSQANMFPLRQFVFLL